MLSCYLRILLYQHHHYKTCSSWWSDEIAREKMRRGEQKGRRRRRRKWRQKYSHISVFSPNNSDDCWETMCWWFHCFWCISSLEIIPTPISFVDVMGRDKIMTDANATNWFLNHGIKRQTLSWVRKTERQEYVSCPYSLLSYWHHLHYSYSLSQSCRWLVLH